MGEKNFEQNLKPFNEEDAEKLIKATLGEDIFEEKKEYKTAIDQQIDNFNSELKDIERSFKIIEKKGTKEQIEERRKQIEFLKGEIEKAEKAKELEIGKFKKNKKEKKSGDTEDLELTLIEYKKTDEEIEETINRIKEKTDENIIGVEKEWDLGRVGKNENQEKEKWLNEEAKEVEIKIEKMPDAEREKIGLGLRNIGFFAQELKSRAMVWLCETSITGENIKEDSLKNRFFLAMAESYRKDEIRAQKDIEKREESKTSIQQFKNAGFLTSNIIKYGRTVADIVGWTAGSPLRYVMFGAQFFSRGAEAAKEARLKNEEVIKKTRGKDDEATKQEAYEQAWKIYEMAKEKSDSEQVSKETLEKAYTENLPQDLLERLKKSESGMATGILSGIFQKILRKDVEFAIKYGKFSESSFEKRLKEFDQIIGHYGVVDSLAMGARYAETAGKAVIAGVQIETAVLLMQRLPEIMSKLPSISSIYNHFSGIKSSNISSVGTKIGIPESAKIINEHGASKSMEQIITESKTGSSAISETNAAVFEEPIIKYQGGKSIWQEAEKQWMSRFKEFADLGGGDTKAAEALKTYNIDRIKDTIADTIKSGDKDLMEKYGLADISDPNKLTVDKLRGIKWNNIFENTLKEKGLVENLPSEQVESIVKHNVTLREFTGTPTKEEMPLKTSVEEDIDNYTKKQLETEIKESSARLAIQQKEIDIDRLTEQTTPVTEIPQSVEMAKSGMDEKTAEIFSGLSSGKQEILNSLFENKTANEFSISDVEKLAEKIKIKNISVENFIKYIETIEAKELSFKDISNLKNNFKIINEWPQAGKAQEYINSKKAIQVIIQKMLSK